MGISYIPGKWDFLRQAGEGVGQVLQAKQDRDRRELETLLALIQGGLVSSKALQGNTQLQKMTGAGAPLPIAPRPQERLGELTSGMTDEEFLFNFGGVDRAKFLTSRAQAETIEGGGASARALTGTVRPEIAEGREALEEGQLGVGMEMLDLQKRQAKVEGQLMDTISGMLNTDPEFKKNAAYAKMGLAGLLEAGMRRSLDLRMLQQTASAEKLRTALQVTSQAAILHRQAYDNWADGLQRALTEAGLMAPGLKEKDVKRRDQMVAEYVSRRPEPQLETFLNDALGQIGLTQDEYKSIMRDLLKQPGGSTTTNTKISSAVELIRSGRGTEAQLREAAAQGRYTPEEVAEILRQARQGAAETTPPDSTGVIRL